MRATLISQQIKHGRIINIIPHHHTIYIRWFIEGGLIFLLLPIIRDICFVLGGPSLHGRIDTVAAVLGIVSIGYMFVRFLNLYMDTIIILDNGMALFTRDSLMYYKTEFFDRVKIDSIQSQQHGIIDSLFNRGTIQMRLDGDIRYEFADVPNPQKRTTKILTTKQHYLHTLERNTQEEFVGEYQSNDELLQKHEKMDILMEALGELIEEHQKKKTG